MGAQILGRPGSNHLSLPPLPASSSVALFRQVCVGVRLAEHTPRDPSASVLYTVVRDHFETFRAESTRLRGGDGLPRFVEDEFRAFLRCGFLAGGFARFRCGNCKTERLVAFSCKGRGFCPSCGGRRMAERAAHLVDHVLPDVPVRQWVLSVPHRTRYLLAWNHDVCRGVARALHRAVERHLRAWARERGLPDARGGGIAVIQRFGGSVNLHVHVHALVLDGVYARTTTGRLRFHAAPAPSEADMADILATIVPAVRRLLARHGLDAEDGTAVDPFAEATPLLAGWAAASVRGLAASGVSTHQPHRLGARREPNGATPEPRACQARWEAFDLHAGVRVPAGHRDRLERLCRYALRPPLADERLHRTPSGDVAVQLRTAWADGTTHVAFSPRAFLARLAVLIPRPRVNLLLYSGVLAPRASWRKQIVPHAPVSATHAVPDESLSARSVSNPSRGWRWADLMRRVFELDVLACPRCGGRLRLIAVLEASEATKRILRHFRLPTEVPPPAPARAPPGVDDWAA